MSRNNIELIHACQFEQPEEDSSSLCASSSSLVFVCLRLSFFSLLGGCAMAAGGYDGKCFTVFSTVK